MVDRPLVLYGAGKLGLLAADLFARLDIPVTYALDRSSVPSARLAGRIPVFAPGAAPVADRDTHLIAVCVVTAPYQPIHDALSELGWRNVVPVYDVLEAYADRLPMGNGWFAGALGVEDRARIAGVLDRWHDDCSRAAHLQFLAWRVAREEWSFSNAPVRIDDRYFIEPVLNALGPDEAMLDAGAHHGSIIARWLTIMDGHFSAVLAVEADPCNAAHLRAWVASLPSDQAARIEVRECALAGEAGTRTFAQGMGLASRLMAGVDGEVPACRLDDLAFPATFAKLHLEGGELDALQGGAAMLRQQRPILAVTVYHNRDGLWRTAEFLMETLADYRFLMRMHGWCGTGAVIYAIPSERWRDAASTETTENARTR